MRVVTLGQQKGGVGKTATAIHLACTASLAGKRVALLDMDGVQLTSLKWAKNRAKGVHENKVLVKEVSVLTIAEELETLREQNYDWVFIDMPGKRDGVGKGLTLADFVIMPARPLAVDVESSYDTLTILRRAEQSYAYLMNICPPQDNASRARKVQTVLKDGGCEVCPVIIIQRIVVPDAIELGLHAGEMRGGEQSAAEYAELFKWLDQRIEVKDGKRARRKATA
jgi:chromosome partitioning protein